MPHNMDQSLDENLAYYIKEVGLKFDFRNMNEIIVTATLNYCLDPILGVAGDKLVLKGHGLRLIRLSKNGTLLDYTEYNLSSHGRTLTIDNLPPEGKIEIVTQCQLNNRTDYKGLSYSSGVIFANCANRGFEDITYFLKRSDNLAEFSTEIICNHDQFSLVRTNGELVKLENEGLFFHKATWKDSTPKSSEQFRLLAGNFTCHSYTHISKISPREITINFFTLPNRAINAQNLLRNLSNVMSWYENKFGIDCGTDKIELIAAPFADPKIPLRLELNLFNEQKLFMTLKDNTDEECYHAFGLWAWNYFDSQASASNILNGTTKTLTRLYTDEQFGYQKSHIFTLKTKFSQCKPSQEYIASIADNDELVTKWFNTQEKYVNIMRSFMNSVLSKSFMEIPCSFVNDMLEYLQNSNYPDNFKSELLSMPEKKCFEHMSGISQPEVIESIYTSIEYIVGTSLEHFWYAKYRELQQLTFEEYTPSSSGTIKLKNLCLYYLSKCTDDRYLSLCEKQMQSSPRMSERLAAHGAYEELRRRSTSNTSASTSITSYDSDEDYSSDSSDEPSYYSKAWESPKPRQQLCIWTDKRLETFKHTGFFKPNAQLPQPIYTVRRQQQLRINVTHGI